MNMDQIKGNWKQILGKVKGQWGSLTNDNLTRIRGKRDELAGKLQHRYGLAKEKTEAKLDDIMKTLVMITAITLSTFT
jgi:uncharacterized protein YjbJ (UPF0337 family)